MNVPTLFLTAVFLFSGIAFAQETPSCGPSQRLEIEIVEMRERTERNFTQGLEIHRGVLYESTGAYRQKTRLSRLELQTKNTPHHVVQQTLSESIQNGTFGEGLTVLANQIYQATWKDQRLFVFNLNGSHNRTMELPYIGWGLTNDGSNLILTDGTPTMRFLRPSDLSVVREVSIRIQDRPLAHVNELEWIQGKIFGNVFQEDYIVRIDPITGCVDGIIDASVLYSLLPLAELDYLRSNANFVLNGIAYDATKGEVYLTGKNWKYIFTVKIK